MIPNIADQHKDAVSVDRDDYTFMSLTMNPGNCALLRIRDQRSLRANQLMSKPWYDFNVRAIDTEEPHKAQTWAKVTKNKRLA